MLKRLFRVRYRIVHDWYEAPRWYVVEKRYWFWPFWFEIQALLTLDQATAMLKELRDFQALQEALND